MHLSFSTVFVIAAICLQPNSLYLKNILQKMKYGSYACTCPISWSIPKCRQFRRRGRKISTCSQNTWYASPSKFRRDELQPWWQILLLYNLMTWTEWRVACREDMSTGEIARQELTELWSLHKVGSIAWFLSLRGKVVVRRILKNGCIIVKITVKFLE